VKTIFSKLREQIIGIPFLVPAIIPGLSAGSRITQTNPCEKVNGVFGIDLVNCTANLLLGRAQTIFFAVVTGMAIILMIYAGIQLISSGGSPDGIKVARQRIINIFIAIVLLVASYAVINLIITGVSYLAGKVV
jgi:hypothetical protein